MKIRFAILLVILCVAGVFLSLEDKFTPDYQNEASFSPVEATFPSGSGRRMEGTFTTADEEIVLQPGPQYSYPNSSYICN